MSPVQIPRRRFHVFVDESSQSGARYMVLGGLVLRDDHAVRLEAKLQQHREHYRLNNELKWGKISRGMQPYYQSFLQIALSELSLASPGFYALVVDTSQLDHHKYNRGDREIGFSKFVYQLLLKCARLFAADGTPIDCFLDDRTTKQTLVEFRQILNNGARKKLGAGPFRRVEYRDSKDSNLIQVVDLFTGAVAYHWNKRHLEPGASDARIATAEFIAKSVGMRSLDCQTHAGLARFSIWKFAASARAVVPRRA